MTTTLLTKKTMASRREYVVVIHREGNRLLVRKSEIIAGIRVPLDETYVLDIETAVWMQQLWINQLHGYSLN